MTREDSGVLCFHSRRGVTHQVSLLRRMGKMAAEKQVPGGGGSGGSSGGGSGGSGGGRSAGGEENKENERPSAGSKAHKEFGDSLSLESILQ